MPAVLVGKAVVSSSPLFMSLGTGHVLEVRGDRAKVEFRPSVFSKPPYLTESKIVDVSELRVVKSPVDLLQNGELDDPWKFDLRQRAGHLLVCNRDGQLSNARTDLLPHQITIAHRVVTSPRRRFLIGDEVGLGKTIEAGIIFYALAQRGEANRILIITPAGLTLQWQEEMKEKFNLDFVVYKEDVLGPLTFDHNDRVIASIDTLKLDRPLKKGQSPGHKTMVVGSRDWDIIVFDEAHKLAAKTWSPQKTERTLNFRLAEELQKRCDALLLLTGTPHQGDDSKFQNLVGLLHERVTFDEWEKGGPDSVPFTELVLRNRKSRVTDAEGNPLFKGLNVHPVPMELAEQGEKQFHRKLEAYLVQGYGYAEQDPTDTRHKAIGFVMTTFQKLAASSTRAIKAALQRRRDRLLRRAGEAAAQDQAEYDARYQGEADVRDAAKVEDRFVQSEVEMLEELINLDVPEDAKADELLRVIEAMSKDNPDQKVLIFTEYLETQAFIRELLERRYGQGCTVLIHGHGMTLQDKKRSQEAFRQRVRFLVSTEAGGEGINLQFCHIEINYDLPWNPFRLAQRYGRLYRYGQDMVVQAYNLHNKGTIEEKVRDYLTAKTETAADRLSKITGEPADEIQEGLLGLFDEILDYDKIYRDALAKGSLKPSQEAIDEGTKKAEEAYRMAYHSLFSQDISPFNPERFRHEIESPLSLEHVQQFVSEFVKRHGRNFNRSSNGTFEFLLPAALQNVGGLERRYDNVTFDRSAAIRYSYLDFMALGHPFVDAAIRYCGDVGFGGLAARREISHSGLRGTTGAHFNFVVKKTIRIEEGEQISFELVPVFVQPDGELNREAANAALMAFSADTARAKAQEWTMPSSFDVHQLYEAARAEVLRMYEAEGLWDEDVECLNGALTVFS